jgi:hypothetical protein
VHDHYEKKDLPSRTLAFHSLPIPTNALTHWNLPNITPEETLSRAFPPSRHGRNCIDLLHSKSLSMKSVSITIINACRFFSLVALGDHMQKGRILRVKTGYNPNSSSMGSLVFALPVALLGITAGFSVVSALILPRFVRTPAEEEASGEKK